MKYRDLEHITGYAYLRILIHVCQLTYLQLLKKFGWSFSQDNGAYIEVLVPIHPQWQ
jgi:hypothetical protein